MKYSIKQEHSAEENFDDSFESSTKATKERTIYQSSIESNNNFRCEECGKHCKTEKHFMNHKKYHRYRVHYEKEYCEICDKNVSKKLFVKHLQKFHADESLELLTKIKQDNERTHSTTENNLKKQIHRCKICIFESSDLNLVQKHIEKEQHHGNLEKQEVLCPYCEHKGPSLHKVKIHIDSKHQEHGEKNYFCDECNKGFIFESSYKEHRHIRIRKQPNRWCEICDIKVVSLAAHIVEKHELNGQRICAYCDYRVKASDSWLTSLKYHIDTKHPDHGEKKFFCNICTKSFMFKSVFSSHLGMHKTTQKEHICELCGQKYVSAQSLKEHMLEKHPLPDATDFVCDICGFSTFSDMKLKRHKFVKHEVEKHKPCPYCEFKSPDKQRLNIHLDRIHPEHGEKQFSCETCGKGFIFRDSFKEHGVYYCRKNPNYRGRTGKGIPRKPGIRLGHRIDTTTAVEKDRSDKP